MAPEDIHAVVRLGAAGDGVVDVAGAPVYVAGVLPGEQVALGDGVPRRVGSTVSPDRRLQPLCSHVERCGGCALQHMTDAAYRNWKPTLLTNALRTQGLDVALQPMISAPLDSRRRAVLAVRRSGDDIALGFHGRRSSEVENLLDCAILTSRIVAALPGLRALASMLLPAKLETHVTVIETSAGLDVAFAAGRAELAPGERHRITEAVARQRLARLSVAGDIFVAYGEPVLAISGVAVVPPPGAFLQAAQQSEQAMAAIAAGAARKAKRVADLFAGLGTFTFALARQAQVLAIDSDRSLIDALTHAARKAQGLKPIEAKVRDLFLDPLSPRELDTFDLVVFDPPRAGAKAQAEQLAKSKVRTVVAVSCNPATLARDLRTLVGGGYGITSITPVDQFLFTPHLEAVAVLERPRAPR
ncbi:MAG: class I SAM-dependent RNA methyltransferase [Hyphomicrobiaceae bacterium]